MSDWLDGRGVVVWLTRLLGDEGIASLGRTDRWARRLHSWGKEGASANVYTLDAMLVEVGLHLQDVPEGLFKEDPRIGAANYAQEQRERALVLLDAGYTPLEISRLIGCSVRAVHSWRKQATKAAA